MSIGTVIIPYHSHKSIIFAHSTKYSVAVFNMSYRLLLSKDLLGQNSSDSEDEHVNNSQTQAGCLLLYPRTAALIQFTVLVLNLLILLLSILQLESIPFTSNHIAELNPISTTFEQNRAFQSLDHAYDGVWAALSLNKTTAGQIRVSGSEIDGLDGGIGSISMSVTISPYILDNSLQRATFRSN